MPPRLSKRQQREQEELEALAGPSKTQVNQDISEDELDVRIGKGSPRSVIGFAALVGEDDDSKELEPSDEDNSVVAAKSKKSKKKKKKKSAGDSIVDHETVTQRPNKNRPRVHEDSKSKAKQKAKDDDFEKALAELSGKHSASHHSNPAKTTPDSYSSFDALNSLLSVSLKHLDPDTELRRFFGSKVITSSGASRPTKVRSQLVRPQPAWPPAHYRAGLTMRALTPQELDGKEEGISLGSRERWWTFEASPRYKGATYEYLQCVMGGDPEMFYNLMYEMPWHADTLLQMAEVFRHREEYSTAADFMSRALFAYERAFSGAFNLTTGGHRLDFDHVESRVFYLALARNVIDLNRRGTPRTAFEFARLLFSLDPHTDPHGALLHLDYLAIKAKQVDWLLGVWDAYANMGLGKGGEVRYDVTILPGWCWSRALALFEKEGETDDEHRESTLALREAIFAFPSVVPLLLDKIDSSISPELRRIDAFKIVTDYSFYRDDHATSLIHLLSHIYAMRSFSLWKPPESAAWLLKTLNSLTPSSFTTSELPRPCARIRNLFSSCSNITEAIYRHVVVVSPLVPDFRRLTAFFPRDLTTRLTHTIEGDPLPPLTAMSTYEGSYFTDAAQVTRRGGARNDTGNRMANQPQDMNIPDQLQALFDMHPEILAIIRERFDIDLARDFPLEVMEDVLGGVVEVLNANAAAAAIPAGQRGMPGGGFEDEDEDADREGDEGVGNPTETQGDSEADDDDGNDDEPFFPVRVVRNLFGRLWGHTAETNETSNSDPDHEGDEVRGGVPEPRADDVD